MTDSRSPHGALTERVCENMSGKGREGKGREGNTCCHLPSIRYVSNARDSNTATATTVVAEPRIEWMAEEDIQCDGVGCVNGDHPAHYIVEFQWPHGHKYRGPRCHTWWTADKQILCLVCDELTMRIVDVCKIVEVLR